MQPVAGVFQPVEQQLEEAAELPLQPPANVAHQLVVRLSRAPRRGLAVGAEQQTEEGLLNEKKEEDRTALFCFT